MDAEPSWRPERAVEIVAGTPPGGGLDRPARALARVLESRRLLDVPVRVRNVPGDGARRAWAYVAGHRGDPHMLSISSPNLTTDFLVGLTAVDHTAFTPLAVLYTEYIAFVVRADASCTTGVELLRRLGRHPGDLTTALATAVGNPNHIALARVARHAGGEVKALRLRVFDSALDAVAAVVAGGADLGVVTAASAVAALAAGSLRALAVSSAARLGGPFAQTPTWLEHGVDCAMGAWRGVTGPPGLTPAQIAFWEGVLGAVAADAAWTEELIRHHWTATYLDGSPLREFLGREHTLLHATLEELGLRREGGERLSPTPRGTCPGSGTSRSAL